MKRLILSSVLLMITSILVERIYHHQNYSCRIKTYLLLVGNYTCLTFFFLLITLQLSLNSHSTFRKLITPFCIILALFFFMINFIGFGWFIEELMSAPTCLRIFDKAFLILVFVSILGFIVFAFFFLVFAIIQRRNRLLQRQFMTVHRDPEIVKNEMIRRNLTSIYNHPQLHTRESVDKFMGHPETSVLMVKLPVLQSELTLFKKYFMWKLDSLKIGGLISNDEKDCVVCFLEFAENELVFDFDCAHCFHKNCVEEWLKIRVSCPSCRNNLRHNLVRRMLKAHS